MSTVKLGSAEYDFFKNYDRKFIQISRDIAILIHIFEKDKEHSWEDIWLDDLKGVWEHDYKIHRESAKQLITQLEGHWCRAFLEALRDECNEQIEQDLIQCGIKKSEENGNNNETV